MPNCSQDPLLPMLSAVARSAKRIASVAGLLGLWDSVISLSSILALQL